MNKALWYLWVVNTITGAQEEHGCFDSFEEADIHARALALHGEWEARIIPNEVAKWESEQDNPWDMDIVCPCGAVMDYSPNLDGEYDVSGHVCPKCGTTLPEGEDFEPEDFGDSPPTYGGIAW